MQLRDAGNGIHHLHLLALQPARQLGVQLLKQQALAAQAVDAGALPAVARQHLVVSHAGLLQPVLQDADLALDLQGATGWGMDSVGDRRGVGDRVRGQPECARSVFRGSGSRCNSSWPASLRGSKRTMLWHSRLNRQSQSLLCAASLPLPLAAPHLDGLLRAVVHAAHLHPLLCNVRPQRLHLCLQLRPEPLLLGDLWGGAGGWLGFVWGCIGWVHSLSCSGRPLQMPNT